MNFGASSSAGWQRPGTLGVLPAARVGEGWNGKEIGTKFAKTGLSNCLVDLTHYLETLHCSLVDLVTFCDVGLGHEVGLFLHRDFACMYVPFGNWSAAFSTVLRTLRLNHNGA